VNTLANWIDRIEKNASDASHTLILFIRRVDDRHKRIPRFISANTTCKIKEK